MARISHPNLALIYGSESWRGIPILVFEFLRGGTVAQRLMERSFSPGESIELGIRLARVLERIHSAGILHQDIKPSNVGYDDDNTPKLMDFGLARMLSDWPDAKAIMDRRRQAADSDATILRIEGSPLLTAEESNRALGTPLYMAPEAVLRKQPAVSFDLWGLAILLYECVTAKHPIPVTKLPDVMRFVVEEDIPDIRQIAPHCREELALFFRKALARDRKHRHSNAKEFRQHLESLQAISSEEDSRGNRAI